MKRIGLVLSIITLGVILVACGQKTYAGIQISGDKYTQLNEAKVNIKKLLSDLDDFDYRNTKTADKIYRDADEIMLKNAKGLSTSEKEKLDVALDNSQHGVKGIIKDAQRKKYNIDGSVASQFHHNFKVIVNISAKAVTNSQVQADKVANKLNKDLKIEKQLYNLGSKHE
ncbi:regulator of extracellular matrix RemA (YlzA/DUF370 family) [Weissella beninensis]|uniref:Lipoprotein n=1 Tax=Periweissella beninensis TaxID=504936 RepID=A0ABT0VIC4_9LACO|nr:hypothetical protein [Periweissella beninensis]MBM7544212.1 regulator of extracellular matrix RemA (YlzA/DUF370 family) [Periweissella beninensis]MCM2437580.1 hypothetical protein [Periweissella beninensis]